MNESRSSRCWAVALAAIVHVETLFGQGYIRISNADPDGLGTTRGYFAPVYGQDGFTPLAGARYSAQLYATPFGNDVGQLAPVGPVLVFSSTPGLIAVPSNGVQVPGVPAFTSALCQLRVWDNAGGKYPTWDAAPVRGASAAFKSLPLSKSAFLAVGLAGLESFHLTPDLQIPDPAEFGVQEDYSSVIYLDLGAFCRPTRFGYEAVTADGGAAVIFADALPCGGVIHRIQKAAGSVTVALTPEPPPQAPPRPNDPFWNIVGISADGRRVVGTRRPYESFDATQAFLGRPELNEPLPLARALALSANGIYVTGFTADRALVRLNLDTRAVDELNPPIAANVSETRTVIGMTEDGADVLWSTGSENAARYFRWRSGSGNVELALGGFLPAVASGDGQVLGGRKGITPGYWTEQGGFKALPGQGGVQAISYDGSLLAGGDAVWTRDGRQFGFTELIRDESVRQLTGVTVTRVHSMSRDGRTLRVSGERIRYVAAGPGIRMETGLQLRIALPGEGPLVALGRRADGVRVIRVPSRPGFHYQLRSSTDFVNWQAVGDAVVGTGEKLDWTLTDGGTKGTYFRIQID